MASEERADVPLSIVRRIMKAKLSHLQKSTMPEGEEEKVKEVQVAKDVLQASAECARIFIHFITNAAADICADAKRQNLTADDVIKAVDESEFGEYMSTLRSTLMRHKEDAQAKAEKRKRKATESAGKPSEKQEGGDEGQGEEHAGKVARHEEPEGQEGEGQGRGDQKEDEGATTKESEGTSVEQSDDNKDAGQAESAAHQDAP